MAATPHQSYQPEPRKARAATPPPPNTARQPAASQEAARLAAIRRYQILDTPPDGAYDRVANLAAHCFQTPIATVTIVDEQRIWFKARHGLDSSIQQIPRDPGLCASAILQPDPYLVIDASTDPRTLNNPLVRGEVGVRFYAAAPITVTDGFRLGTVNIIDQQPRPDLDDLTVLADLAAVVADELELRLAVMRTVTAERRHQAQVAREKRLVEQVARLESTLAGQLEHALAHRVAVEQAKGMLMATEALSEQAAFERLRQVARSQRRPIEAVAAAVRAGNPLPPPTPSAKHRRTRPPTKQQPATGTAEFSDGTVHIDRTLQPPGLRLKGEVGQSSRPVLTRALTAAITAGGEVHVDLAEVTSMHLEGLQVLVERARRLPAGCVLVLEAVPAELRRVMDLVGWAKIPGLRVSHDDG